MLPFTQMIEVREYLDRRGLSPFGRWFEGLDTTAAAKVSIAITRIGLGNFSNVKGISSGVFEYKLDFGPGYRIYLDKDGDVLVILLGGGSKKTTIARYCGCNGAMAGLQAAKKESGKVDMALTKYFRETVKARVQRDPAFRKALLIEGVEAFLDGDVETGKAVLRDCINATVGFGVLAKSVNRSPKSLMRMLGPSGNPQAQNLFEIIAFLQREEGVHLKVKLARAS